MMPHKFDYKTTSTQFGIYAIVGPNNKKYIGSTACNFYDRWCAHLSTLRRKKHSSILLQRAWDKYGEDKFTFEIIEVLTEKTKCPSREAFYIENFNSMCPLMGYNVSSVRESRLGHTQSMQTRQKISASLSGIKRTEIFKDRLRRSRRGEGNPMFGKSLSDAHKKQIIATHQKRVRRSDRVEFNSIREAAELMKVKQQGISQSLRKGCKCAGFNWFYI